MSESESKAGPGRGAGVETRDHPFAPEGPDRLRLAATLRRLITASLELDHDAAGLAELIDDLDAVAVRFDRVATGRRVALFGEPDGGDMNPVLPFSPIMGRANPVAPPIEVSCEGERVVGIATLGVAHQGADGLVHGGVIASLYDEVLAAANMAAGVAGPTAKLTIRYRRPTPLGERLRFEAWVEKTVGRRVHTRGRCLCGDTLLTDAEAIFVKVLPDGNGGVDWASRNK